MITVDSERCEVRVKGKYVHLPPREYRIFLELYAAKGRVLTREFLLYHTGGDNRVQTHDRRMIDALVYRMRGRLKKAGAPKVIRTVNEYGYSYIGK